MTELIATRVERTPSVSASWIELDLSLDTDTIHAEVRDYGERWVFEPSPFTFEPEASSGWGLYLVDRLASRWELTRGESTTRIWFELDL